MALIMISKIYFNSKNLTSNAGIFLLLENAKSNGIFELIENDLVVDNDSMNKINRHFDFWISITHIITSRCICFVCLTENHPYKAAYEQCLV